MENIVAAAYPRDYNLSPETDMKEDKLKAALEAMIMASAEPVGLDRLCKALSEDVERKEVRRALKNIAEELTSAKRGYRLVEIAGGYQFLTAVECAPFVERLKGQPTRKQHGMSRAMLETLAIIAYKQPVKRADIEAIRGVSAGDIIRNLIEQELVKVVGKEDAIGRPLLYGTTKRFLKQFGLKSVKDLPSPAELSLD